MPITTGASRLVKNTFDQVVIGDQVVLAVCVPPSLVEMTRNPTDPLAVSASPIDDCDQAIVGSPAAALNLERTLEGFMQVHLPSVLAAKPAALPGQPNPTEWSGP